MSASTPFCATPAAEERPGCLAKGLGWLDIVVGLLVAVSFLPRVLSAGVLGSLAGVLLLLVSTAVVYLGFRVGMRALKVDTTRAKTLAFLYALLVLPALFFLWILQGISLP